MVGVRVMVGVGVIVGEGVAVAGVVVAVGVRVGVGVGSAGSLAKPWPPVVVGDVAASERVCFEVGGDLRGGVVGEAFFDERRQSRHVGRRLACSGEPAGLPGGSGKASVH